MNFLLLNKLKLARGIEECKDTLVNQSGQSFVSCTGANQFACSTPGENEYTGCYKTCYENWEQDDTTRIKHNPCVPGHQPRRKAQSTSEMYPGDCSDMPGVDCSWVSQWDCTDSTAPRYGQCNESCWNNLQWDPSLLEGNPCGKDSGDGTGASGPFDGDCVDLMDCTDVSNYECLTPGTEHYQKCNKSCYEYLMSTDQAGEYTGTSCSGYTPPSDPPSTPPTTASTTTAAANGGGNDDNGSNDGSINIYDDKCEDDPAVNCSGVTEWNCLTEGQPEYHHCNKTCYETITAYDTTGLMNDSPCHTGGSDGPNTGDEDGPNLHFHEGELSECNPDTGYCPPGMATSSTPGPEQGSAGGSGTSWIQDPCNVRTDIDLSSLSTGGGCIDKDTSCASRYQYWADCRESYESLGGGCAAFCIAQLGDEVITDESSNPSGQGACKYYFRDCKTPGEFPDDSEVYGDAQSGVIDGVAWYKECQPKPELAESFLHDNAAHCSKAENIHNEEKCNAFQQYCDYNIVIDQDAPVDDKRMTEEELFGGIPEVLSGRFSGESFGLFSVAAIPDESYDMRLSWKPKTVIPNRQSKWVFWHWDALTSPTFEELGCDCLEGEYQEQPEGWWLGRSSACHQACHRDWIGTEERLFSIHTLMSRVCHREYDVEGMRWDPSPNMNLITPLNKLFPDMLGPGGLNMGPGEGGSSWYWWGHSKPSWNKNDQTSAVTEGEKRYDSEIECRQAAHTYFRTLGYLKADTTPFLSVCDMFSSKTSCTDGSADGSKPLVSNATCRAACLATDDSHDGSHGFNTMGKQELVSWFQDNCMYTPYQPENDYSWPNFYVPDTNQCFGQWQIGYEDQGCDACLHPQYDNSAAFNYGWSYAPMPDSGIEKDPSGLGGCNAQCGKIIMDGPGRPRDVKTAQECQQECQNDPNCVHFQWRPVPDWDRAAEAAGLPGNRINQVRSCLLKNKNQFDGALRAKWDGDGNWIWHPMSEGAAFANIYQADDCAQSNTGEGYNWCLGCKDPDGQKLWHAFKWRNNMISGPKFCNEPRIYHGSEKRPNTPYWDRSTAPVEQYEMQSCPDYEMLEENPDLPPDVSYASIDGSTAEAKCVPKPELLEGCDEGSCRLEGGDQWAEHCYSANNATYTVRSARDNCLKFQQYCDWVIGYGIPEGDYKRMSESSMQLDANVVHLDEWSGLFSLYPPTDDKNDAPTSSKINGTEQYPSTRKSNWVAYHYEMLGVQTQTECDCFEPGCNDARCGDFANSADVYTLHFLIDRVCHRESDVAGLRWDPSPNPMMQTATELYEAEWGTMGMIDGEAGSSWYWYGQSKGSWNLNPQNSFVGLGQKQFATEAECRAYVKTAWSDEGFNGFDSICRHFSSKTQGVSNSMCAAACDGDATGFDDVFQAHSGFRLSVQEYDSPELVEWFTSNCKYTPYQAESDHAWPNIYVPESNSCFGQWQIGYEDQGCDGCMHSKYDNSDAFDFGWSYKPLPGFDVPNGPTDPTWVGNCEAKCGKFIMEAPGVPKDVKSAHECQDYCQQDPLCDHFVWRTQPDYTAAETTDEDNYENVGNRLNKVRLCNLKTAEIAAGALKAKFDENGFISEDTNNCKDDGFKYCNGEYIVLDSQYAPEGDGNNWYLECKEPEDPSKVYAHAWKWRNNFVSGPKYCDRPRIRHGATRPDSYTNPIDTISLMTCPTQADLSYSGATPVPATLYVQGAWPVGEALVTPDIPAEPDFYDGWHAKEEVTGCCDVYGGEYCQHYVSGEEQCKKDFAWGCAFTCSRFFADQGHEFSDCKNVHAKEIERIKAARTQYSISVETPEWERNPSYDGSYAGLPPLDYYSYPQSGRIFTIVDPMNDALVEAAYGMGACESGWSVPTTSTSTTTPYKVESCQYTTSTTTTEGGPLSDYPPVEIPPPGEQRPKPDEPSNFQEGPGFTPESSGYEPVTDSFRDGSFSIVDDHNVNVTTAPNVPTWCLNDVEAVPLGQMSTKDYYYHVGLNKLRCAGWKSEDHALAMQSSAQYANCADGQKYLTYDSLAEAVGMFPDFLGYDNLEQNQLDLALFLANVSKETTSAGNDSPNYYGYAFCFVEEVNGDPNRYDNQDNCEIEFSGPSSPTDASIPNNVGYFGRGGIQLTWCINYGIFRNWSRNYTAYSNDETDFLTNPGLIIGENWAWSSALFFYMSPEADNTKPSMHSLVDFWKVGSTWDDLPIDNDGRIADLGYSVNIINGYIECAHTDSSKASRRLDYFFAYLTELGFDTTGAEYLSIAGGCTGQNDMGSYPFKYWYLSDGTYSGGDTQNIVS